MAKRPGSTSTSSTQVAEPSEVASRLRLAVARLHRTLRQHADAGLSPSQLSALVAIERHGSMTLGELADPRGRRPSDHHRGGRPARGRRQRRPRARPHRPSRGPRGGHRSGAGPASFEPVERKDAWLTRRIAGLDADELERLAAALDVLEALGERAEP